MTVNATTARTPIASQLWLLAIAALAIRLGAAVAADGLRHPELNEYDSIARTLVSTGEFLYWHIGVPYFSYAPPLDAWLAAASYWATGSIVPLMLLQCAAGAATASVAGTAGGAQ